MKKMRRILILLLVAALLATMVLALDNPAGITMDDNSATLDNNYGTVTNNYGTVTTNYGTVTNNGIGGTVINNNSTVTNNYGTVNTNAMDGTVINNNSTVTNNYGTVNTNNSTVTTNYGTVDTNTMDGTVNTNNGSVTTNTAGNTVDTNNGSVGINDGSVGFNHGTVTTNNNTLGTNYGTVTANRSTVFNNFGTVHNFDGTVSNNSGTVIQYRKLEVTFYDGSGTPCQGQVQGGVWLDGELWVAEGESVMIPSTADIDVFPLRVTGFSHGYTDGQYTLTAGDVDGSVSVQYATRYTCQPSTDIVDAYAPTDLTLTITEGDYSYLRAELEGIGTIPATLSGNTLTIPASAFAGLPTGGLQLNIWFEFAMIDGTCPFSYTARSLNVFSSQPVPHAVTILPASGGTVSVDKATAAVGEIITVTAQPDAGYQLTAILVNGQAIQGTTFVMPEGEVTVTAQFAVIPETTTPADTTTAVKETSKTAQTGDAANLALYCNLMAMAVIGIAVLLVCRKKRPSGDQK